MEPFIDKSDAPHTQMPESRTVGAAEWLTSHVYTSACIGVGILLILGVIVVKRHLPESATNTLQVWGGGGGSLMNSSSYDPQNPVLTNLPPNDGVDTTNSIVVTSIPVTKTGTTSAADGFDVQAFAATLGITASAGTANTDNNAAIQGSYEFVPQGLISTSTPGRKRTAVQQALYEYGNDAGSYIQTYESAHENTAPIISDQIADRQNAQKGQAVKDIGDSLKAVGTSLENMDGVPDSVSAMNDGLAQAYIDIGQKLSAVPDAPGDSAFITAIQNYDAAVGVFTKKFVTLAQYFTLSGVTFSSTDPGSVFTFSGGGGI